MAKVREPLLGFYKRIYEHKALIVAVGIAAVLLLAFGVPWKGVLFFPLLFLAAAYSTMYEKIAGIPPAVELVTLTSVAIAAAYGAWPAAAFGAITVLAAEVINKTIDAYVIGYVAGRAVTGALAGIMYAANPDISLVALGMVVVVVFNLIAQSVYLLQCADPAAFAKTVMYVAINLLFNAVVFATLASPLIRLITP